MQILLQKPKLGRNHIPSVKKFMLVSQGFNSIKIKNTSTDEQFSKAGSLL
jgi:hypothetical protein